MTLTIEDVLDNVLKYALEKTGVDETLADRVKQDVLTYSAFEDGSSEETVTGSQIYRDQIVDLWGFASAVARVGFEKAKEEETFLTDARANARAALVLADEGGSEDG